MEILESLFSVTRTNLLQIITLVWVVWCAGMALGIVVCNVSGYINRRTLTNLRRRYERAGRPPDPDTLLFEIDPERLKTTLTCREQELRDDIDRMGLDFESQSVLRHFRTKIQKKLVEFPATYHELMERLTGLYQALDDLQDLVDPDQLFLARMALKRGETGKTIALLKRAQVLANEQAAEASGSPSGAARSKKLAAQATFLLGLVAEANFDYFTATQYYQQAADLQPNSLRYLGAAAELSYAFGEFQETEQLLLQVFKIQEKLLGPEHPDLAMILNNLGVLRHAQGRHSEAEAFYHWALEICESHKNPGDPDVLNLRQNYAAFLTEVGRKPEADLLKAQVVMA
jgi:tetratricopeptide (TPR) repeat protein